MKSRSARPSNAGPAGRAHGEAAHALVDLSSLDEGTPLMHIEHGVGRFEGLTRIDTEALENQFVTLRYADDDRLHVPVSDLYRLRRYGNVSADVAPLHSLGNEVWVRERDAAIEKACDSARELVELQARRAVAPGFSFRSSVARYMAFADRFEHQPTSDQQSAIDDVIADLRAPLPMDRVVCGDVGFGKTEIAMRAAFLVADAGRQVIVLAPTTLLARQHYRSFTVRFAGEPFRIELFTGADDGAERDEKLDGLEQGSIDIAIGTHALLGKRIVIGDLGLVIVDEEHRFGVRHKERLKKIRARAGLLALTATPIPRTLAFGVAGLRDLSIIASPPGGRMPVDTLVTTRDDAVIRDAIEQELARDGQVYVVHDKVKSIDRIAGKIMALNPDARVGTAHGKLDDTALAHVMDDFGEHRLDVLVATTVIESGIHEPNANTLIVHHAERLGLAQLHQLRGRVGRAERPARALFLTSAGAELSADATDRLEALQTHCNPGAGFALAEQDLEIRGAGEFLGDAQSGHVEHLGAALYSEVIASAVEALRNGRQPDVDLFMRGVAEVDLGEPALLPEQWLDEVDTRLETYGRIASARNDEALDSLVQELERRYGALPAPACNLFETARVRLRCERMGIRRVHWTGTGGEIDAAALRTGSVDVPAALVRDDPTAWRLTPNETLESLHSIPDRQVRLERLWNCLSVLQAGTVDSESTHAPDDPPIGDTD